VSELDIYNALKDLGLPGASFLALFWALNSRKRNGAEDDAFESFRREVIDRLARIETRIQNVERQK